MRMKSLIALALVVVGCSEKEDGLSELTISGVVRDDRQAALKGVEVKAYCGSQSNTTLTKDDGSYELIADVVNCTPLAIEFAKETYLPAARTLPLPPPTSPVIIDVTLPVLTEILCDENLCVEENGTFSTFGSDPVWHGWVVSMMGQRSLPFVGGEFRTTTGDIVWSVGFGYFDFRDRGGVRLEEFPPYSQCTEVPRESLDWLVDVAPGNATIDLDLFRLKSNAGQWTERNASAVIKASFLQAPGGAPIIVDVAEDKLDTVRAGTLNDGEGRRARIWMCMPIDGSGWYMWGSALAQKSCFNLNVTSNCGSVSTNAFFTLEGEDLGFLARTALNRDGKACLDVAASEPPGIDYDLDLLGGETFLLKGEARAETAVVPMPSLESPRQLGSCEQPSSCMQLEAKLQLYCGK